jgi:hypothetical protein
MKAIYLENTFTLPSSRGQLTFSLQHPLPKTYYETPFAILTAFNPMNETTPWRLAGGSGNTASFTKPQRKAPAFRHGDISCIAECNKKRILHQ